MKTRFYLAMATMVMFGAASTLGNTSMMGTSLSARAAAPVGLADAPQKGLPPVVVFAVTSYDHLRSDLGYIGQLTDQPELAQGVEGLLMLVTQFRGLVGLDKSRPIGGALSTDGNDTQFQLFVPVKDLEKLLGVLVGMVGQPEQLEGDVYRLQLQQTEVFAKQVGDWAYFGPTRDSVDNVVGDPLKVIGNLTDLYDVGVRINMQNVPASLRQMAADQLQIGIQEGLQREEEETDEEFTAREKLANQTMRSIVAAINETDTLTLGFAVDAQGRRLLADFEMLVVPGGTLDKQLKATADIKSHMAGFLMPEAIMQVQVATVMSKEDATTMGDMLHSAKGEIERELANTPDLTDEQKSLLKQLGEDILDVAVETIKQGKLDMGAVVVTKDDQLGAALGMRVSDGSKIEEAFFRMQKYLATAKLAAEETPEVKLNVAEYQGVKFHTVSVPFVGSAINESQRRFLGGETVEVTFGFGKEVAYAGLGPHALQTIKQVIDKSAEPVKVNESVRISYSLGRALRLMAKLEDGTEFGNVIALLADEDLENDQIHITATSLERGARYRFEMQEGALRLLVKLGVQGQGQNIQFAP